MDLLGFVRSPSHSNYLDTDGEDYIQGMILGGDIVWSSSFLMPFCSIENHPSGSVTFKRTISCKAHESNNNKPWMSVFVISDLFVICFVKLDKHLFWWSSYFWSCIIRSVIEWYGVWEIPVSSSTLWCCLQLHLQLLARIPPLWYLYHTHGISEIQFLQVSVWFFSMHSCIISNCGLKFRAFVFMLLMWLKGGSSTSWQCTVCHVPYSCSHKLHQRQFDHVLCLETQWWHGMSTWEDFLASSAEITIYVVLVLHLTAKLQGNLKNIARVLWLCVQRIYGVQSCIFKFNQ